MNQFRLEQLRNFYEEEPNDPFNAYALATELLKFDLQAARQLFEELLVKHPNYWATYYHAAALYTTLEEFELAEQTYQKGIEVTGNLQNEKALKELKGAYQMFLDEREEW
ncbi:MULTISPECIES: enzyme of heme biosynthesis [Flectobacillus]|uniref:enzyme of heme biosynthesis n=1 Tax=Flectobacillus TaxID=101 RepID=UPI000BA46CF8|nr:MULTISPECIES: enzyme of heme biosynthesis [Flectobacillus]MDI9871531.1 tetratricopeptide repeat protein [Flectobacillus roseus]PAC29777.1 enzyme of heme biosynthesis [Flectobacillus sp. BAB-3569]